MKFSRMIMGSRVGNNIERLPVYTCTGRLIKLFNNAGRPLYLYFCWSSGICWFCTVTISVALKTGSTVIVAGTGSSGWNGAEEYHRTVTVTVGSEQQYLVMHSPYLPVHHYVHWCEGTTALRTQVRRHSLITESIGTTAVHVLHTGTCAQWKLAEGVYESSAHDAFPISASLFPLARRYGSSPYRRTYPLYRHAARRSHLAHHRVRQGRRGRGRV